MVETRKTAEAKKAAAKKTAQVEPDVEPVQADEGNLPPQDPEQKTYSGPTPNVENIEKAEVGGVLTDDGGRPLSDEGGRPLNIDSPPAEDVEARAAKAAKDAKS